MSPYSSDGKTDFLLLDGSSDPGEGATALLKSTVDKVLNSGGTVWVWDVRPAGAARVSKLLGHTVSVAAREASSFVVKQSNPLLAGLDNAGLCFSEGDDWHQMPYGLGGEFVQGAQTVLAAGPADWRRIRRQIRLIGFELPAKTRICPGKTGGAIVLAERLVLFSFSHFGHHNKISQI